MGLLKNSRNSVLKVMILLLIMGGFAFSKNLYSAQSRTQFVIDNFEDGNIDFNPEWFQFGDCNLTVQRRPVFRWFFPFGQKDAFEQRIGNYALNCEGNASHWYVGGFGTYLGIDCRNYTMLSLDIYGYGQKSGRLKVELFDDDNNNWQIELDKNFKPLYDDKWTYEFNVDWKGWRTIKIPFTQFKDDNPSIGDHIWNPYQTGNSGGLIQIQFIMLTTQSQPKAHVHYRIDNIKFLK